MTKEELLQLINMEVELIAPGRNNRPGRPMKPLKITVHNTSNTTAGADARRHSRFVRDTGYYIIKDSQGKEKKNWVSWHFTVDDKVAIKQLPTGETAFHAGTEANQTSVAVEICMHAGIDQDKANERAAQLIALLCYDLAIPLSNVVTHNAWTGKKCPVLLLGVWDEFKEKIRSYLDQLNAVNVFSGKEPGAAASKSLLQEGSVLCWNNALADDPAMIEDFLPVRVQNGFNDRFLKNGTVELPVLSTSDSGFEDHVLIHHQNLSIYFNKKRKLALYSACNYDKDALFEGIDRSNAFREDRAVDTSFQLADGFYLSPTLDISTSQNYFDRGHLIARRYNQWGQTEEEARAGERDTYYFTTIHPQVKELNQDEWEQLESFIIERKQLEVKRVSIIAGTFLEPGDPVATYRDKFYKDERKIRVPQLFWKIVYYETGGELRKIAFLMSQRNRLRELDFVKFEGVKRPAKFRIAEAVADPFDKIKNDLRTYIVNSSFIEAYTSLAFPEARELYTMEEPREAILGDNETHLLAARRNDEGVDISEFI